MKRFQMRAIALPLLMLLAAGALWAAPTIKDAKADPAVVKVGDLLKITALVDDPGGEVAKVKVVVSEAPELQLPMTKGEGGLWTFTFPIPETGAGTYHFEVTPLDKDGKTFQVAGQTLKSIVSIELRAQELPAADLAQLQATAKPWRTEAQIAKVPRRKAGEPFNFLVMGDSRSNPQIFAAVLKVTAPLKWDFALHTGDIVPKGLPEEYAFWFTQIKDLTRPLLITPGNHELGPSGGKLYAELYGPTDYYFDTGGIRFISLDNAKGVVTPEQLAWLEGVLKTNLRKVVFMHQPPNMITEWAYHAFGKGAQETADLFAANKVERVYVGHIHAFDVAEYKGVRYVLTGGGGAGLHQQMAPGNFNHALLVEVLPTGLKETVYKTDGTSFVLDAAKWMGGEGQ